jgi:HPt (histidine-containing phosphotransfer) domain-containing protein
VVGVPGPEPVDRAAYAVLVETVSGDAEFLAQLVDEFVIDAARLVDGMRAAARAGLAGDVARAAHQLKSSSASLGAAVLPGLCGDLETRAGTGASQGLAERVSAIEIEVLRVTHMLRALGSTTC